MEQFSLASEKIFNIGSLRKPSSFFCFIFRILIKTRKFQYNAIPPSIIAKWIITPYLHGENDKKEEKTYNIAQRNEYSR